VISKRSTRSSAPWPKRFGPPANAVGNAYGGSRDIRRLIWLAVLVGCSALAGWAGPWLRGAGGPVLLGVIGLVVLTGFWWFTIWFLLGGRISWRDLFPAAVATALFWLAMEAVFSVATAIQGLYEAAFELEGRGARDMPAWLPPTTRSTGRSGWSLP
jgi:hypothetical protein